MREPAFWYAKRGPVAACLAPLAMLYAWGTARRLRRGTVYRAPVPVICVGNLNAGGTGKTPSVIAIVQFLGDMGKTPHILSRGYGGTLDGPLRVDAASHGASKVGDEPLLLSAFAPVWIGKDRAATALAAAQEGADVLVMDDGFQNPGLAKDYSVIVVDAARGFGNGCVIPAGPLREPVHVGARRAHAVLAIGSPDDRDAFWQAAPDDISVLTRLDAALEPLQTGMPWSGLRAIAFAGIGHPEKFFATLAGLGADIQRRIPLDDHQPLTETLMSRLKSEAKVTGAQLVTTEKDAVRLPASFRKHVLTLPVRLGFAAPEVLRSELERVVA
ncbi:MAG: tetraacyldisaccharide 4'-kinase [Pseudomonadota bacterium]